MQACVGLNIYIFRHTVYGPSFVLFILPCEYQGRTPKPQGTQKSVLFSPLSVDNLHKDEVFKRETF